MKARALYARERRGLASQLAKRDHWFLPNSYVLGADLFGKTMPSPPRPPDELPKYIAEGIPKQNDATLRVLRDWIGELLAYRQDVTAEEITGEGNESIEAIEDSSEGAVVIKKVSCGKESCKCQRGKLHGPYKYLVQRKGKKLDWDYRGPVDE